MAAEVTWLEFERILVIHSKVDYSMNVNIIDVLPDGTIKNITNPGIKCATK